MSTLAVRLISVRAWVWVGWVVWWEYLLALWLKVNMMDVFEEDRNLRD